MGARDVCSSPAWPHTFPAAASRFLYRGQSIRPGVIVTLFCPLSPQKQSWILQHLTQVPVQGQMLCWQCWRRETPGSPYKAAFQHCFVDFFLAGREERGGMKVNNYLNKHMFQWIKSASMNQARLQLCRAILGATKKNLVLNTS